MTFRIDRAVAALPALALSASALTVITAPAAHATSLGTSIIQKALSQGLPSTLGDGAHYGYGPCGASGTDTSVYDADINGSQSKSCNRNGKSADSATNPSYVETNSTYSAWCADFAGWSWWQGGVDPTTMTSLGDSAVSFAHLGAARNTFHRVDDQSYTPQPGDAIIWVDDTVGTDPTKQVSPTNPGVSFYANFWNTTAANLAFWEVPHVSLVASVSSRTSIVAVGGNEGHSKYSKGVVHDDYPFNPTVDTTWNQRVFGYVSPGAGTPPPPPTPATLNHIGIWNGGTNFSWDPQSPLSVSGRITLSAQETKASRVLYYLDDTNPAGNGWAGLMNPGGDTGGGAKINGISVPHYLPYNTNDLPNGSTHTITAAAFNSPDSSKIDSVKTFSITVNNTATPAVPTVAPGPSVRASNGAMQSFQIAYNGHLETSWQSSPGSAWSTWLDLGGSYTGSPTAVLGTNGGIGVFVTGTDGNIYTAWQSGLGANLSSFTSIGGGSFVGTPSVVVAANNAQQIFAINSYGELYTAWQSAPNSTWSGWTYLSNGYTGSPASVLGAGTNAGLSVYATGTDGNLYTQWQNTFGAGFSGKTPLGGGTLVGSPSVVKAQNGGLQAFGISATGDLLSAWQSAPGSTWSAWSPLSSGYIGNPVSVLGANGGISVFATGKDGNVYTQWQSAPSDTMSPPANLGGGIISSSPIITITTNGALAVYGVGDDNQFHTAWQNAPSSGWTAWSSLSGAFAGKMRPTGSSVVAVSGGVQTFKIDPTSGHLLTNWQTGNASNWVGWADLGGSFTGTPVAIVGSSGGISVFVTGTDGNVYTAWQNRASDTLSPLMSIGGDSITSSPAVVLGSGGAYQVFGLSGSGDLLSAWQNSPGSGWTNWNYVSGSYQGSPAAVLGSNGGISVFVTGTDGNVYTQWQTAPSAAMSTPPTNLGGSTIVSTPTALRYRDGSLGVFALDTGGNLQTTYQNGANGAWVAWSPLGNGGTGGLTGTPTAVQDTDGLASVFARTTSGAIAQVWQTSAGGTMNNWQPAIGSGAPALVSDPSVVLYPGNYFGAFAVDGSGAEWTSWQFDTTKIFHSWASLG